MGAAASFLEYSPAEEYYEQYHEQLSIAIKETRLDQIENLIQHKKLAEESLPLHMAASFASLDSLELLISAGFQIDSLDLNHQSALHKCAMNRSLSSSLCAYYLMSLSKTLIDIVDKNNCTPMDLAIKRNNTEIVQMLLPLIQNDSERKEILSNAVHLARKLKRNSIVEILETYVEIPKLRRRSSCSLEKAMLVWELFFTNAAMNMMSQFNTLEDPYTIKTKNNNMTADNYHTNNQNHNNSANNSTENIDINEDVNPEESITEDSFASDWFSWVLIYDKENEYRVVNLYSYEIRRLEEHLDIANVINPQLYGCIPNSCGEAIYQGWLTYYDIDENNCFWYNVFTYECENYLPIGSDGQFYLTNNHIHEDNLWVSPDFSACYCWTVVVLGTEEHYLYNYCTGHSLWDTPVWWDNLVNVHQNGWCLCMNQSEPGIFYWWNSNIEQSEWLPSSPIENEGFIEAQPAVNC